MIESGPGGIVITGEHIELYKLLTIRRMLEFELAHPGLKASRFSALKVAKQLLGIKGGKKKVLAALNKYIDEKFPKPTE